MCPISSNSTNCSGGFKTINSVTTNVRDIVIARTNQPPFFFAEPQEEPGRIYKARISSSITHLSFVHFQWLQRSGCWLRDPFRLASAQHSADLCRP
eukprot:1358305-Rhodomonas_salina.3